MKLTSCDAARIVKGLEPLAVSDVSRCTCNDQNGLYRVAQLRAMIDAWSAEHAVKRQCAMSTDRDQPRILIVRVGAMGDVLHGMPAVAALAGRAARMLFMGWAVEPRWSPLLQASPDAMLRTQVHMPLLELRPPGRGEGVVEETILA